MLRFDDKIASLEAVKDFKRNCGSQIYATVIVLDNDGEELLRYSNMEIVIANNINYYIVNVMWDEQLADYRSEKLYGRYSTDYVHMESTYKELTILSDERKIIIQG